MQVDVSALAPAPVTAAPAAADEGGGSSEGFVRTRSYNLSITYDKYYQVCVCALMAKWDEALTVGPVARLPRPTSATAVPSRSPSAAAPCVQPSPSLRPRTQVPLLRAHACDGGDICIYIYNVCMYICMYACMYMFVLPNPPIPSSRSKHFLFLRPNFFFTSYES